MTRWGRRARGSRRPRQTPRASAPARGTGESGRDRPLGSQCPAQPRAGDRDGRERRDAHRAPTLPPERADARARAPPGRLAPPDLLTRPAPRIPASCRPSPPPKCRSLPLRALAAPANTSPPPSSSAPRTLAPGPAAPSPPARTCRSASAGLLARNARAVTTHPLFVERRARARGHDRLCGIFVRRVDPVPQGVHGAEAAGAARGRPDPRDGREIERDEAVSNGTPNARGPHRSAATRSRARARAGASARARETKRGGESDAGEGARNEGGTASCPSVTRGLGSPAPPPLPLPSPSPSVACSFVSAPPLFPQSSFVLVSHPLLRVASSSRSRPWPRNAGPPEEERGNAGRGKGGWERRGSRRGQGREKKKGLVGGELPGGVSVQGATRGGGEGRERRD